MGSKTRTWIFIGLLVLITISVLGWWLYKYLYTSPVTTQDSTSNWKVYTDDIHGFSLRYPQSWNNVMQKIQGENVAALSPAPIEQLELGHQVQAVHVQVHDNPKHLASIKYFEQVLKPSQSGSACTDFQVNTDIPKSLKNLDVTVVEGMCGVLNQGPRTIISKPNFIVDISSSFVDTVDDNLIYQIISTFEFIEEK